MMRFTKARRLTTIIFFKLFAAPSPFPAPWKSISHAFAPGPRAGLAPRRPNDQGTAEAISELPEVSLRGRFCPWSSCNPVTRGISIQLFSEKVFSHDASEKSQRGNQKEEEQRKKHL